LISEPLLFTTVVLLLNQGTFPKTGRYRFQVAFFVVLFWRSKKVTMTKQAKIFNGCNWASDSTASKTSHSISESLHLQP